MLQFEPQKKRQIICHLYPPHLQSRPVSVELAMLRGRRGQTWNNGYSSAVGTSMRVRESLASACVWARVSLASGFWLPALFLSHQEELGLGLIWASPEFSELTSYIRLNPGAQQSLLGILRTIKKDQDDVTFSNNLPFSECWCCGQWQEDVKFPFKTKDSSHPTLPLPPK